VVIYRTHGQHSSRGMAHLHRPIEITPGKLALSNWVLELLKKNFRDGLLVLFQIAHHVEAATCAETSLYPLILEFVLHDSCITVF
jgi:hypothetical protein